MCVGLVFVTVVTGNAGEMLRIKFYAQRDFHSHRHRR